MLVVPVWLLDVDPPALYIAPDTCRGLRPEHLDRIEEFTRKMAALVEEKSRGEEPMTLTLYDEFAGWGGSSQGATAVPGVELIFAANHNQLAVDVHSLNFPDADHYRGDVAATDIARFPRADLFWASPSCPPWSNARGQRRDFDLSTQGVLFGSAGPDSATARARALMEEIPRYLDAMTLRGRPVLGGVVENVVECRLWDQWSRWIGEIRALGYHTRVIALNSMHARPSRTRRAPQSRDRLYVAYWLAKVGRPDWDKWLRPQAWCPACDQQVTALQAFKQPGVDMGRHGRHGQYHYRCPSRSCRHRIVEPEVLPAAEAIDWTLPLGPRIGDRSRPLRETTLRRIEACLRRYSSAPALVPAGGTWRDTGTPLANPMPTRTSKETDALVVPLRHNGVGRPAAMAPLMTITAAGEHHALVVRHNTPRGDAGYLGTPVSEPLRTLTTAGHQSLVSWVYAYDTGSIRPTGDPLPTQTSVDGDALVTASSEPVRVEDCTFRMLDPREIAAGMAFAPDYKVLGGRTERIAGYGRAVTPPAAEVIVSALVEAITGEQIETAA